MYEQIESYRRNNNNASGKPGGNEPMEMNYKIPQYCMN